MQDLGEPLALFGPVDTSKPRGRGAVKKAKKKEKNNCNHIKGMIRSDCNSAT